MGYAARTAVYGEPQTLVEALRELLGIVFDAEKMIREEQDEAKSNAETVFVGTLDTGEMATRNDLVYGIRRCAELNRMKAN